MNKRKKKFLFKLILEADRAGYIRNKDMVIYEYGILAIRMKNREMKYYTTSKLDDEQIRCIFYDEPGEKNDIEFESNLLNENWDKVYAYFFDQDGVFLMYADRMLMEQAGIRYDIASAARTLITKEIRKEALIVAQFIGIEVAEQVRHLLDDEEKNMSVSSLLG